MKVKKLTLVEGAELHIERFPNFHKSGNISGMKDKVYGKDALLVRCGNYIYNVSKKVYEAAR